MSANAHPVTQPHPQSAPKTSIPKPSRKQALENGMFVRALRQTGNITMAAAMVGMHRTTFIKRSKRFPGFAADMDGALAAAQAALQLAGGVRSPEPSPLKPKSLRTLGGEIIVHRGKGRRIQLRRSLPGKMTKLAEQAFFRALSASANVRLSCAAVGFSEGTIYRRRLNNRNFAKEMQVALELGYDRLNIAILERAQLSLSPDGHDEEAWREWALEDNPVAPVTPEQAIQLLYYHRQTAVLKEERRDKKRKRVTEAETSRVLGGLLAGVERRRNHQETGQWRYDHETPPPALPPLEQVTGWSAADPKKVKHHPEVALFGGWRIGDMTAKMEAEGIKRQGRRTNSEIWEDKMTKRGERAKK